MQKYEQLADAEDGTRNLVINASAKKLMKDPHGRVVGVEFETAMERLKLSLQTASYWQQEATVQVEIIRFSTGKDSPNLMHLPTTNGDHSQGEGIDIAMDIGAKAIALKHVQVHPTGLVNPDDPDNKTKFLAASASR